MISTKILAQVCELRGRGIVHQVSERSIILGKHARDLELIRKKMS